MSLKVSFNNYYAFSPVKFKVPSKKLTNMKVEEFHIERDGNGIKVVSEGFVDKQKEIQSQAKNAGLVNILRLNELRYGTVENAVVRNREKQTFADVSNIPETVGEQKAYYEENYKEAKALADKLGLTLDELLSKSGSDLATLLAPTQEQNEGGNE